jgi:hypothetical protein
VSCRIVIHEPLGQNLDNGLSNPPYQGFVLTPTSERVALLRARCARPFLRHWAERASLPLKRTNRWRELKKAKMCSRGCKGWYQRPSTHVPSKEEIIDEISNASKKELGAILKARELSTEDGKKISGHEIHRIHANRLYDDIQKGHKLTETERQYILTYNDQHPHVRNCPMYGTCPGKAKRFQSKPPRTRVVTAPQRASMVPLSLPGAAKPPPNWPPDPHI